MRENISYCYSIVIMQCALISAVILTRGSGNSLTLVVLCMSLISTDVSAMQL